MTVEVSAMEAVITAAAVDAVATCHVLPSYARAF